MSVELAGCGVATGDEVGAWLVEARLEDGAAIVFAAQHRESGQRGALKVLRPDLANDAEVAARFARDARALRSIDHDAVVPVIDAGKLADGRPWVVTPQLEGRTLREELRVLGTLPPLEAWTIARALLDALSAAHPLGLVHRDVSPDSVFLEKSTTAAVPRLDDFGLPRGASVEGDDAAAQAAAFAAPEQLAGDGVLDGRVDLYGVGATLYAMLVGRAPFAGTSEAQVIEAVLHEPPPSPRAGGAAVGAGVDVFVRRLLAKDPADRYPNAWAARSAGDNAFGREAAAVVATMSAAGQTAIAGPAATAAPGVALASAQRTSTWSPTAARRYVPRYLATHALVVASGSAAVVGLGYAGPAPRDVIGWLRDGGWTMVPILVGFLAAVGLVPVLGAARGTRGEAGHRAFALAALPVILATLGTWLAWVALRPRLQAADAGRAFADLQRGLIQAYLPRFVGLALGAVAFATVAAIPTRRFRERRFEAWRTVDVAAAVLGATTVAAATAGAWSGAFAALVATGVTFVGRGLSTVPTRIRFSEAIDHAVASVAATLLALAAAFARLDARAAAGFGNTTSTRAERVVAILAAADERDASRWVAAIAIAIVVGMAAARVALVRPTERRLRLPRATSLLLLGLPAFFAVDALQGGAVGSSRDAITSAIATRLALEATLDPPPATVGSALGPPAAAVMLQATPAAIAVDGRPVARTDDLASEPARDAIVEDLARALAASTAALGQPDVALVVDRRAPWSRIATLLRLASQAGARTAEVLLTRGAAPMIPVDAPPEAAAILPNDLLALPIEIAASSSDEWEFATFEEAAAAWQALHADGEKVTVGVGR